MGLHLRVNTFASVHEWNVVFVVCDGVELDGLPVGGVSPTGFESEMSRRKERVGRTRLEVAAPDESSTDDVITVGRQNRNKPVMPANMRKVRRRVSVVSVT